MSSFSWNRSHDVLDPISFTHNTLLLVDIVTDEFVQVSGNRWNSLQSNTKVVSVSLICASQEVAIAHIVNVATFFILNSSIQL